MNAPGKDGDRATQATRPADGSSSPSREGHPPPNRVHVTSTAPAEAPAGTGTPERHTSDNGRSVPQLIRELADEGQDLVRQEIALAKAEMQEKLDTFQRSAISMAVGGALLLAALLTALWAVNRGLTALLGQVVSVEVAIWLAPLILTVVLAAIGLSMVKGGQAKIRSEGLKPHRTTATLEEDKRWAKAKAREVKEEIKHG